jgi:hypothetical protein
MPEQFDARMQPASKQGGFVPKRIRDRLRDGKGGGD